MNDSQADRGRLTSKTELDAGALEEPWVGFTAMYLCS